MVDLSIAMLVYQRVTLNPWRLDETLGFHPKNWRFSTAFFHLTDHLGYHLGFLQWSSILVLPTTPLPVLSFISPFKTHLYRFIYPFVLVPILVSAHFSSIFYSSTLHQHV